MCPFVYLALSTKVHMHICTHMQAASAVDQRRRSAT